MAENVFKNLRGIRKLMYAVLKTDTEETLEYDTPKRFAGVREAGGETEESTATEYYDNQAAIVTTAEGADVYSLITSILANEVKADVEGRKYNAEKKLFLGGKLKRPYIAIGFIGTDTEDVDHYYWILKGKLTGGKEKHITKDDGTETTNLEWEYTSIYTTHPFAENNDEPLKYIEMEAGAVTEEDFFKEVYNPDSTAAG